MSEDRLIKLALQARADYQSLLQWWLGVSIGVAALGHFAVKRLNWGMLILVCILYIAFTNTTANQLYLLTRVGSGMVEDLARLSEAGDVSGAAQTLIQTPTGWSARSIAAGLLFLGTFFGCQAYFIFSFVQAHKKTKQCRFREILSVSSWPKVAFSLAKFSGKLTPDSGHSRDML